MRSEGDRWDPATSVGLKGTDEVLVLGNPAFMPWLSDVNHHVDSARKNGELKSLLREKREFDKVIISREHDFSPDVVAMVGPLLRHDGCGLLIAFPADDGWTFEQAVSFYYPEAQVRTFETTFGTAITVNINGVSWRYYV